MTTNIKDNTQVALSENQKAVYEKKTWFIFSWYKKIRADSIGTDLHIMLDQKIDRIYLNGEELVKSQSK